MINIRFLIAWLALGLLASAGCTGPKVFTDFDRSIARTYCAPPVISFFLTGWL
jgi:hypothetical protein